MGKAEIFLNAWTSDGLLEQEETELTEDRRKAEF